MKMLPNDSIDSIVTDPPYGLGFKGKAWDSLPPGQDWAEECLRVLKPGGHLLAFGGTRTWHRLAVAVEDSGFEMRDSLAWMYGSGFPKHRAALKPAFEPIVMARKPYKGSLASNEANHGTGALNIEGCRAGGRWPANVILDGSMAGVLDAQSGNVRGVAGGMTQMQGQVTYMVGEEINAKRFTPNAERVKDEGGASRFFQIAKDFDCCENGSCAPFRYLGKAPKKERPVINGISHTTVKPLSVMRWLVRLVTPAGGTVLEPFAGSGTTVEACILEGLHCIAIEREAEYIPLIQARIDRQDAA